MKKFIGSLLVLILSFSVNVSANEEIDTNKKASININHSYNDVALSNVECNIYKVATLSNNGYFSISDEFKKYPIDFNKVSDTTEWYKIADTLDSYVKVDGISPYKTGKTSQSGIINFSELEVGLYLVNIDNSNFKNETVKTRPFLVSVPSVNDKGDLIYNIDITSKSEGTDSKNNTLKVNKIWLNDDELKVRPDYIKVNLYKNGEKFDSVILNEKNNWTHIWELLDGNFEWTVIEEKVPNDYRVSYENYEGITTITNTYLNGESINTDSIQSSNPAKTGDKSLVLPCIMLGVGLILLFVSRKK